MKKLSIDMEAGTVSADGGPPLSFATAEGFELVSKAWIRAGWDAKYVYSFTWLGRPIIQLPEDMIRLQEVIWNIRPTLIIETGVAHGGSLVFSAGLLRLLGGGRVVGVDIEIRPHNRAAIEAHPLACMITLIQGSSVATDVVSRVKSLVGPEDRTLILLDSNHSKDHVLAELRAYSPLTTVGSYIVAMDGIMKEVAGAPRTGADWNVNNPLTAIDEFLREATNFEVAQPPFAFNESSVRAPVTYWPSAYLRRRT